MRPRLRHRMGVRLHRSSDPPLAWSARQIVMASPTADSERRSGLVNGDVDVAVADGR